VSEDTLYSWEQKALRQCLESYVELETGQSTPVTAAERHFIEVCRGNAEPDTDHENAYLKYKEICQDSGRKLTADEAIRFYGNKATRPTDDTGKANWYTNEDWNKEHPDRQGQ
jgi:uncharacterized protein YifE (UPF0438 family)